MSPKRCKVSDCSNFASNDGLCNSCFNGWSKPTDNSEEPPKKKIKISHNDNIEKPKEEEQKEEENEEEETIEPITSSQYKSLCPDERAKVSYKQLVLLYSNISKQKNVSSYFSGSQLRRMIESKLKMKRICLCGNDKFLGIFAKACDGNYFTLPSGKEGSGYLPQFSGMEGGDGPNFDLCTHCGRLYGFDKDELVKNIQEAEKYIY